MVDKQAYAILARCVRLTGGDQFYEQLSSALEQFSQWHELAPLAEAHGLAPLFYHHTQQGGIALPDGVKLQFQGLFLRHKLANTARLEKLSEILAALAASEIKVLLLKGAALATTVYPQPGLRPMADLDLLVPLDSVVKAQEILRELGYQAPPSVPPTPESLHHLPVATLAMEELDVSVELHHRLGGRPRFPRGNTFDQLWRESSSLVFQGQEARTLGPADMLWHLHTHLLAERTKLIRIVDLVSFAERVALEADWAKVRREAPRALAALSVLQYVTPLSSTLLDAADIPQGRRPSGVELPLFDWPPLTRQFLPGGRKRDVFRHTFLQSELSLRMYYGLGSERSVFWHRWLRHPLQILFWYLEWRFKLRRPS